MSKIADLNQHSTEGLAIFLNCIDTVKEEARIKNNILTFQDKLKCLELFCQKPSIRDALVEITLSQKGLPSGMIKLDDQTVDGSSKKEAAGQTMNLTITHSDAGLFDKFETLNPPKRNFNTSFATATTTVRPESGTLAVGRLTSSKPRQRPFSTVQHRRNYSSHYFTQKPSAVLVPR